MFVLDGKVLSPDAPFSHNGVNYPANWLRLTTLEEKEAIGIQEVPDLPTYDQRFYWGYDQDGKLIPKDHTQLVEQWSQQTTQTAYTLLLSTDWMIVRQIDDGTVINLITQRWRGVIRSTCAAKITAIQATTTTDELAAYVTSAVYSTWPTEGDVPSPYPSWIRNPATGIWEPPIQLPSDGQDYEWNEENQEWVLLPAENLA